MTNTMMKKKRMNWRVAASFVIIGGSVAVSLLLVFGFPGAGVSSRVLYSDDLSNIRQPFIAHAQESGCPYGASYSYTGYYNGSTWATTYDCSCTYVAPPSPPTPPAPATPGTVNVSSNNAVVNQPVDSSWSLNGPDGDECNKGISCSGNAQSYTNLLLGDYTLAPQGASGNYAFRSVEGPALAKKDNRGVIAGLLALGEDLLPVAHAWCVNANGGSCGGTASLDLTDGSPTGNFTILWDPIAAMEISPGTMDLSSGTPQENATVANSGAPGSTLGWSASISDYTKGVSGWLSLSKTSGSAGNGSPDAVTFSANAAPLAEGDYQVTVTFKGTSSPGTPPLSQSAGYTKAVVVNLRVGGGCSSDDPNCGGYKPSCSVFSANPTHIIVPLKTTLSYSCTNVSICNINGSDGSVYAVPVANSSANGSQKVGPKGSTTYTLSCFGAGGATYATTSASVDVTATTPGVIEIPPP